MISPALLLSTLSLVGHVFGHTIFQQIYVNGVSPGRHKAIRYPTYNGPIYDVTSNDIICNGGINPLVTPFDTTIVNVPAGATVTTEWRFTLTSNPGEGDDPIHPSHKGPISIYLARVPSALQTTVTGLQWFKIYEDGYTNGVWAVDKMIADGGKVNFQLPVCVPSGNYFLRTELIALHAAGSALGAQFYVGCAQINVTGGGSLSPATVSIPGAYPQNHPGIIINIYQPSIVYQIPGPRPITCGGTPPPTSSTSRPASTSSSRSTSRITSSTFLSSARPSSSSSRPSSTSTPSGGAPLYGQCGGQGWNGPTTCAQGTCTFSNQWYSQCLP